ncbi:MAG TPA: hypothetical protein VF826_00085 [Chloroflexia bacterium]|jgi:hypothetical protein
MISKKLRGLAALAVVAVTVSGGGLAMAANATVEVTPGNMQGWAFVVESGAGTGQLASGPAGGLGAGSAHFNLTTSNGGVRLASANSDYVGVRLDDLEELSYSTYQQQTGAQAVALQLAMDYNSTDTSTVYQGRLVYEPYQDLGNAAVVSGVWQTWDALRGGDAKWWMTNNGNFNTLYGTNPCPQASPCTLDQILTLFPNAAIHTDPNHGGVMLKAGAGWPAGWMGSADALTVGVNGNTTTYDFEPTVGPPTSKEQCKNGGWETYNTPRHFNNQGDCVSYVSNGK